MAGRLPAELEARAHQFADHLTGRINDRPTTDFLGTVRTWDGTTLTITWRGSVDPLPAKRHASYTPAVGDWVHCTVIDGQIVAQDRVV